MANAPSSPGAANLRWRAILTGAFLTVVFMLSCDLLTRALGAVSIAPGLGAIAFFVAGFVATRLLPGVRALDPALGSAGAVLIVGLMQFTTLPELEPPVTAPQIALFVASVAAMAFLLSLLGARVGLVMQARRRAPRA